MDTSSWQALLLGIIEGITEFLPISSTGHLILLIDILEFSGPPGKVFEISIQFGAILAVCWLYRAKLFGVAFSLHREAGSRRFAANLALAFLPAMALGLLLHDFIKDVLFSPLVVASMLVAGGVVILLIERFRPAPRIAAVEEITPVLALKIGFCQSLAMIPGTSRSAATILGGMLLGLERKAATEFSFFLAIPTLFAATVYDLYKNADALNSEGWQLIAIGFMAAFASALLTVRWLIGFISRHGYGLFAWYRIALGTIMLCLLLGS